MNIINIFLGVFIGLLSLIFLIVGHEFGHFLMARRNGVRVKEFGVGFPPRAKAWLVKVKPLPKSLKFHQHPLKFLRAKLGTWKPLLKKNWNKDQDNLIFSLNYLPLGGFCAMDGESDDDTRPGTFGAATYLQKTKILFGGVLMNWLIAFIILTVLCWTGLPTLLEHQFTIASDESVELKEPVSIANIRENSPAAASSLSVGDGILSVSTENGEDAKKILTAEDLITFNSAHAGETLLYTISHPITILSSKPCAVSTLDSAAQNLSSADPSCTSSEPVEKTVYRTSVISVTLNKEATDDTPLLGIEMTPSSTRSHYTWSAPVVGAGLTLQVTAETYKGLGSMLVNLITGAARQVSPDADVRAEGRDQVSEATAGVSGIVGILGSYFPGIVSAGPAYTFLLIAIISISLACMNVLPIPALDGGRWLIITIARLRHKRLSKEAEQKIVARAFIFLLILMALITIVDVLRLVRG